MNDATTIFPLNSIWFVVFDIAAGIQWNISRNVFSNWGADSEGGLENGRTF